VDAQRGDVRELQQLALVRQPQLEPLRSETQPEERREVYRTLT
jgi:hypothetical protein